MKKNSKETVRGPLRRWRGFSVYLSVNSYPIQNGSFLSGHASNTIAQQILDHPQTLQQPNISYCKLIPWNVGNARQFLKLAKEKKK